MSDNLGLITQYLLGSLSNGTLTGVTSGTSLGVTILGRDATLYLRSLGTTSSGTIVIEEASWDPSEMPYGGTWSAVTTINASSFTGSAQLAYHFPSPTPYHYVRVRIGTSIGGGGSVAVRLVSI